ncbi:MAG: ammonium transporter [Candidatus Methylopumilus sp.]|jgi:Amt family ammonium transporter|nr:ammonium transporter [Candidatus Methylopumilus sp.]
MKKLLAILALMSALSMSGLGLVSAAHADEVKTDAVATVVADAAVAPDAAAPAAETVAPAEAAKAPTPEKGDIAWMIVATILVTLMVIPGLGLFYGGLVRSKNMLSVLMQTFVVFSLIGVLWAIYGYSVAFTDGSAFIGGLSKAFLAGVTPDSTAATFSKGVVIPEYLYIAFQMTFAAITPALIVGAFAERMKFSAVLLFVILWFTFSYLPIAHMVWFWAGPDAYTSAEAAAAANAGAGFLFQKGALDFAGGTVVHINAGIAGLVGAIMLGKRIGYGREAMTPHSLTMTMIGASLLWVGWYGFNVGSNLEATGFATLVFVNTLLATCAATLSWTLTEWLLKGKPSMLGAASGAVAGLVAVTPACGFAGPMGAILLGLIVSPVCFFFVSKVKSWLGYDDSLDVFGVHGVGGIIGAIGTGIVVNPALGGTGVYDYVANAVGSYDMAAQVTSQAWGVVTTVIWSTVVAVIAYKIVDLVVGLRVSEETEREGLDTAEHGERAYHM